MPFGNGSAPLDQFEIKDPVLAATTGVLPFTPTYSNGSSGVGATLTGTVGILAFDGYTPVVGDRLLVKNQASTLQNGIYSVTTVGTVVVGYVLTRTSDFNSSTNIVYGDTVAVLQGTVNANQQFTMNNQNAITVGTTAITFAQTSGGSQLTAGTNINITGNTVKVIDAPVFAGPTGSTNGILGAGSPGGTGGTTVSAVPLIVGVKSVTVKTTGSPADIATIAIPAGITRYTIFGQSTDSLLDGSILTVTSSGVGLHDATFEIRTAAAGAGSAIAGETNPSGIINGLVLLNAGDPPGSTAFTSPTITIRQILDASAAGTASFYLTISPLI